MYCPECGTNTFSGEKVCPRCGCLLNTSAFQSSSGDFLPFGTTPIATPPVKKRKAPLWILPTVIAVGIVSVLAAVLPAALHKEAPQIPPPTQSLAAPLQTGAPDAEETTAVPDVTVVETTVAETDATTTRKVPVTVQIGEQTAAQTTTQTTTQTTAPQPKETVQDKARRIIPYFDLRYYLTHVSDADLENLCAVYEGVSQFQSRIQLPNPVSPSYLQKILFVLCEECPELFQIALWKSYAYYSDGNGNATEIEIPYAYTQAEYKKMRNDCEYVINTLVERTKGMSEFERECTAFDFITQNCSYSKRTVHAENAYGSLVDGLAKCDGIAKGMKWVMEAMGIQCLCVSGIGSPENHTWNVIRIDGIYYTLDVTPNVPKEGDPRGEWPYFHDTMNVTDTNFFNQYTLYHYYDVFPPVPKCNVAGGNYYARVGGYVPEGADPYPLLYAELQTAIDNGQNTFFISFETTADFDAFFQASDDKMVEYMTQNCNRGAKWSSRYLNTTICFRVTLK